MRVAYPFASVESGERAIRPDSEKCNSTVRDTNPEVVLESGLIPLQEAKNLVSIEWDADTPPNTSLQIQTRTGNEVAEVYRYYDSGGVEVSAGKYNEFL